MEVPTLYGLLSSDKVLIPSEGVFDDVPFANRDAVISDKRYFFTSRIRIVVQ